MPNEWINDPHDPRILRPAAPIRQPPAPGHGGGCRKAAVTMAVICIVLAATCLGVWS